MNKINNKNWVFATNSDFLILICRFHAHVEKIWKNLWLWERLNSSCKKILPSDEVFVSGMFQGFGIQPGQAYLTYHAAWQKYFSKQLKKISLLFNYFWFIHYWIKLRIYHSIPITLKTQPTQIDSSIVQ